jgi:hypothetical protein
MAKGWSEARVELRAYKKHLKTLGLAVVVLATLYAATIRPLERRLTYNTGINSSRGMVTEPLTLWRQTGFHTFYTQSKARGVIGGVAGGVPQMMSASMVQAPELSADKAEEREMVRTSAIELVVQHPAEAAEKIRSVAERLGGFLVSSEMRGEQEGRNGTLTIRVPAARFEEARGEIRKLGLRIESERTEAQDVTRQYVDQQANLRNLRAEEAQYLAILRQSHTVKDTLEVSEKLSEVRGQIEQQQAEFAALSKQIETVAITVSLRAEAEARVLGLNWRPLFRMKMALRDGIEGIAEYATTMTAVIFYLPTVLLWLVTILVGAAIGWKGLRWAGAKLFGRAKASATAG